MSRRGRKRKFARREANGRVQRVSRAVRADQERQTVMDQPHRRWLPEERRKSQNLEDELGRMYEAGLLGRGDPADILLAAGRRYQRLMAAFHRAMVSPGLPGAGTVAYVADQIATDPDHDPLAHLAATETPEERHRRVCWEVDRVTRVFAAGGASEGREMRICLDGVCLHDQRVGNAAVLRAALDALARLWHMYPVKVRRDYVWHAEKDFSEKSKMSVD